MSSHFSELFSVFSPTQCVDRLSTAISFRPLNNPFFWRGCSKPVLGEVTAKSIYLQRRINGRNSFQTVLLATMHPTQGGTAIMCKFSIHPATRMVTWVWCASAVLIGGPVFLYLAGGMLSGTIKWNELWDGSYSIELMSLGFFVAYALMYLLGRGTANGEDEFLKQFLMQTLEANEVTRRL